MLKLSYQINNKIPHIYLLRINENTNINYLAMEYKKNEIFHSLNNIQ